MPTLFPERAKEQSLADAVEVTGAIDRARGASPQEGGDEVAAPEGGQDGTVVAWPSHIPAEEAVTVIFGDAGAGKSMLARLLALGLVEGTGLGSATQVLPAWMARRSLPVLIDLRQYAVELASRADDPAGAIRDCIVAAWGPHAGAMLDSDVFAECGLIILDGVEALLWPAWGRAVADGDEGNPGAWTAALDAVLRSFPGIPRVLCIRNFGRRWLSSTRIAHTRFEIAPVNKNDVRQIASAHLFGCRDAGAARDEDPRLLRLIHNRDIRRLGSGPMIVKLALDLGDEAAGLGTDQIIGHFFDQMITRGMREDEEQLPESTGRMRELLRKMAYRSVAAGGAMLSEADVLACGAALDMRDAHTIRAARWLGDRTELIAAEPDDGLSFTHDIYQERLAAEELAAHQSVEEVLALAQSQRWHDPVKYMAGLVPPETGREIVKRLFDAGKDALALDAALRVVRRLPAPEGDELLDRCYSRAQDDLSERLRLLTVLAELDTPAARRLLVDAALPLQTLSTSEALERHLGFAWAPNQDVDQAIQMHSRRVTSSDHLLMAQLDVEGIAFVIQYAGETEDLGGTWTSGSICAVVDRDKLPYTVHHSLAEVLGAVLSRVDEDDVTTLVLATLQRHDATDQLRLLALGLLAERLFAGGGRAPVDGLSTMKLLLRGLHGVPPSESPAFTIGLVNALLSRAPVLDDPALHEELSSIRQSAVLEYGKHFLTFAVRSGREDGYWIEPPATPGPDAPMPPRTADAASRIHAALREIAAEPPVPSAPAPWKTRSFVDAYVARTMHQVHKLKAKDTTTRWAYYYVLVNKDREPAFLAAIEGDGTIDLQDYGTVIASCYGETPNQEVRDELKRKYGFEE